MVQDRRCPRGNGTEPREKQDSSLNKYLEMTRSLLMGKVLQILASDFKYVLVKAILFKFVRVSWEMLYSHAGSSCSQLSSLWVDALWRVVAV